MRFLILFVLVVPGLLRAGRSEFNYAAVRPEKKEPVPILLSRNPLVMGPDTDKPLPILKDKEDPIIKLQIAMSSRLKSVIREPKPIILIDSTVYQPGDEIEVKGGLLPKHRVVLKSVGEDKLIFNLISTDPTQPGQVEASYSLSAALRNR
jgi:hypothetical protein